MTDERAKATGSRTEDTSQRTGKPQEPDTFPSPPDETGESPDAGTADQDAWTSETERRNRQPPTPSRYALTVWGSGSAGRYPRSPNAAARERRRPPR